MNSVAFKYLTRGMYSEAIQMDEEMIAMDPNFIAAYWNLGIIEELKSLRENPQRGYAPPLLIAYIYEGLGRVEEALDWLDLAVEERDGWLIYLNSFPRFESLRDEPRFKDILGRLQLPALQLLLVE